MTSPTERAVYNAVLRRDFLTFVRKVFETLNPGRTFFDNWHIEALAYELERVRTGENGRLIVNMPPRSLKSLICSVAFPAFLIGHEPAKRIIAVSYSADLAGKLSNDFRAVVTSPWYRE